MRNTDKPVVIVNPAAGRGRAGDLLPVIKGAFAPDAGGVFVTLRPGDAERWARTFRGHPGIVAIGGEGTVHEVLNGMDLKRQALGVLPLGAVRSLGRDLGTPQLASLLVALAETAPRQVDVLAVSLKFATGRRVRRYAASSVAIGYPMALQERACSDFPDFGPSGLALAAAFAGFAMERFGATVTVDGGKPRKVRGTGWLVNNTRHACGVPVFPGASLADRALHLMELAVGPVRQALHNLSLLSRVHVYAPAATRPARRVVIGLDRARMVMLDGERYPGVVGLDCRILPGRLRLWIPAGARIGALPPGSAPGQPLDRG